MSRSLLKLSGQKFGLLVVVERAERGGCFWRCLCQCGGDKVVTSTKLRSGHVRSCGCLRRRSGLESPKADKRPVLERLAEHGHTDLATGCRIWNGTRKEFGHGYIWLAGDVVFTHRAAWQAEKGPIPAGLDCLHNCPGGDHPACWNTDHLWLGTQADNNADRDRKGRHVALKGEMHGCAKLTAEKVIAIRADRRRNVEIGRDHGISGGHIGRIKSRHVWSHI